MISHDIAVRGDLANARHPSKPAFKSQPAVAGLQKMGNHFLPAIRFHRLLIAHNQFQPDFFDNPQPENYRWKPPMNRQHYADKLQRAVESHDRLAGFVEQTYGALPERV